MIPLRFEQRVTDIAMRQQGAPYIWAGEGDYAVRDGANVLMSTLGCPAFGFDCAGLVKWAAYQAGGPDLRGWWSADHFWRFLPDALGDVHLDRLVLFGSNGVASHVAIDLGRDRVVEAAGGDHTTLTYADATRRGYACVRSGRITRGDILGYRSLAALATLPIHPPTQGVTP